MSRLDLHFVILILSFSDFLDAGTLPSDMRWQAIVANLYGMECAFCIFFELLNNGSTCVLQNTERTDVCLLSEPRFWRLQVDLSQFIAQEDNWENL